MNKTCRAVLPAPSTVIVGGGSVTGKHGRPEFGVVTDQLPGRREVFDEFGDLGRIDLPLGGGEQRDREDGSECGTEDFRIQ